jgi:hypothetical protein
MRLISETSLTKLLSERVCAYQQQQLNLEHAAYGRRASDLDHPALDSAET